MRTKLLIVLSVFSLIFLIGIFSCDTCGPFPNKFKTTGIDWINYKAIFSDTSYPRLILAEIDTDSVEYNMYSIQIRFRPEFYFAQNCNKWNFNLINSAYACDPAPPHTDEKIDSIVITSSKNFNPNHPSGFDLSDLFDVIILDDANVIYYERFRLNDYINTKPPVPNEMTLILREQPVETTDFEFLVRYFQDGIEHDYFEFLTDRIVIKRE